MILLIILSASMSVTSDQASNTTQTFLVTFDSAVILQKVIQNSTYTILSTPECISTGQVGSPQLPQKTIWILLPYNTELQQVNVDSISIINLSLDIADTQIMPMQQQTYLSDEESYHFNKNEQVYKSKGFYPREIYEIQPLTHLAGYPVIPITLHPFRYNPLDGRLYQITTMNIEIKTKLTSYDAQNMFYRGKSSDIQRISMLVINPEMVDTYPLGGDEGSDTSDAPLAGGDNDDSSLADSYTDGLCDSADTFDYVIVTNNDLSDTTGYTYNWSDLISHREQRDGLSGCIVTIEDIDDCSDYYSETEMFNDSAAHLREFCKDAYLDWNTDYMLLAGDWSETNADQQILPARLFTDNDENESGYNTMPSDLYYSNLDGNWYDESHNVWGGGRNGINDKLSELSIGRIPVSTAEQISNAIEKIIWYDECDDEKFLRSTGFLGGDLGWISTSKQYMEEIRVGDGSFSEYTGFEEYTVAYPAYGLDTTARYYEADYSTENDAVLAWLNAINNNELCLINHLDHGSYTHTLSLGYGSSLTNSHFFIGVSQACLSGRYISGTSGVESFICNNNSRGSFALLLNTGYGYGSSTSTSGASQLQHKIWWDYFFEDQPMNFDNWRLGPAMRYTKDVFSSIIDTNSHAYCYVWYSWNLFGDPAQRLRITTDTNHSPQISEPYPMNNDNDVSQNHSFLSITIHDSDGDLLNWSIETSPSIGENNGVNDQSGTKICVINGLSYDTEYTWYVNVSDGSSHRHEIFSFTVEPAPVNHLPTFSQPNPDNGSANVDINCPQVSIQINDAEADTFWYTIQGVHVENVFKNNEYDGTKTAWCITPLPYDTEITWYVNATDAGGSSQEWYTFTTRGKYVPQRPSNVQSDSVNRTCNHLEWTIDNHTDVTRVERHHIAEWDLGNGTLLYNGSSNEIDDDDLTPGKTYYYRLWAWNKTDDVYSLNPGFCQQTTDLNHPPEIQMVNPVNNSRNLSLAFTFFAQFFDAENDELQWEITCSHGETNSSTDGSVIASLFLNNLLENTTYKVWVNVTDGYDWNHTWYQFTTHQQQIPPKVSGFFASVKNSTEIMLTWDQLEQYPVLLECHETNNWTMGEGIELYNGSENDAYTHNDLERNTTYYYQIWHYNSSSHIHSEPVMKNVSTPENMKPVLSSEHPGNNSIVSTLPGSWSIDIDDEDNDHINWNISISSGDSVQKIHDTIGQKTVSLSNIDYEQTYMVYVNITDGYCFISRYYVFHTDEKPNPDPPSPPTSGGGGGGFIPIEPNHPPIAVLGNNLTGIIGETITFTAINSTDEDTRDLQYRWDFTSDGIWDTEWLETPLCNTSYTRSGLYVVTVEVTDGTSSDQDKISVQIMQGNQAPTIQFLWFNQRILLTDSLSYDVTLVDEDADDCRYMIDYGDNNTVEWSLFHPANSTQKMNHQYQHTGTFTIRILVEDVYQAQSGWITLGNVTVLPLTDSFYVSTPEMLAMMTISQGETICFDAYEGFIIIADDITMISWYIDDILLETGSSLCYQFNEPGISTLSCSYVTDDGRTYQTDQLIRIESKVGTTLFPHSLIIVFGVMISASLTAGSLYYFRRKNDDSSNARHASTRHIELQRNSSISYEEISKKVNDVLKR